MSAPTRKRRWLLWAGVGMLLLLLGGVGGLLLPDPTERALREAVAETDRLDPHWRFEELDARGKKVPDEENAALCVLDARALLPAPWPPDIDGRLADLPPQLQLDDALAADLKTQLANV